MNNHHSAPCKHIYALAHVLGLFSPEQYQAASKATPPDHFETPSEFAHIKFGSWSEEIHADPEQVKRMRNGQTLRGRIIDFDPRTNKLLMKGSHDEAYHVTLDNCDCVDFCRRHLPCKHIYCLADSLGLLPSETETKSSKSATRSGQKSTRKTTSSAMGSQKKSTASDGKSSSQKNAEPVVSSNIRFGQWPTKTHLQPGQEERMKRGHKIKDQFLTIDPQRQAAYMMNPDGAPYRVTLSSCDCKDFSLRHLPCEHIYCLADSFGLLPTKPAKRATSASSAYSNIKFGHWPRRCHSTDDQIARIKKGKKLKNTIITLDWNSQVACMKGDSNMDYYVTLNSCNCSDFYRRQLPCEHIYCLADTLGLLEPAATQKKNARS